MYIDQIKRLQKDGVAMEYTSTAVELRRAGLDHVEAGWVLRHVFGKPMGEAVHDAKTCNWEIKNVRHYY